MNRKKTFTENPFPNSPCLVIKAGATFGGVLSIHAEGSLATQRMVVYQMADWKRFKAAAQRNLGIPTDHPDYQQPLKAPWTMPESLVREGAV
jgi:hypothetical protein